MTYISYKMEKLNLKKVWEIMNTLSHKESVLSEDNIYVSLLGNRSSYCKQEFDSFLNYYSFKIDGDSIVVFNTDPIPYESWNNDDISFIPSVLISFSSEKLDSWMETEIKLELERQERDKLADKERIKEQIERLQKQLNNL